MAKRKLRLWEALALSLGLMGPTLAMAGNGQGIIGTVGKAVPLVFLLGFIGVALVAYGFIRLTQRYNHAGSAYALVGATLGRGPGSSPASRSSARTSSSRSAPQRSSGPSSTRCSRRSPVRAPASATASRPCSACSSPAT